MEPEDLDSKYKAVVRDLVDMAAAMGVDPNFNAMAKRIAELLNIERHLKKLVAAHPGLGQG